MCGWREGGGTDRKTTADRDSYYETALGKEGGEERLWLAQESCLHWFLLSLIVFHNHLSHRLIHSVCVD